MVLKWALSSSARHSSRYRIGRFPILLNFLYGTEVGAVEFCLAFYVFESLGLSGSSRHSIWYSRGTR